MHFFNKKTNILCLFQTNLSRSFIVILLLIHVLSVSLIVFLFKGESLIHYVVKFFYFLILYDEHFSFSFSVYFLLFFFLNIFFFISYMIFNSNLLTVNINIKAHKLLSLVQIHLLWNVYLETII